MHDNDEYETSDPITIGGSSGQYVFPSPWHTECEWAIISALGLGTFGFVAPALAGVPVEVNVPATAGNITLFTGTGMLNSALVTAVGTTDLEFLDGAGNVIAEVPSTATLDQSFPINQAFNTSLVAVKATTTPIVTVTYTPTVSSAGTAAMIASFAIGSKNPKQPSLSAVGADSFGNILTSSPDNNNGLQSYVGGLTNQAPFVTFGGDNYMPLPSPAFVYLTTNTPANTEVLVTLQFRRKLDRVIPEKPRQAPHTHTHVMGRGQARRMSAGFDAKYPEEGVPYEHQELQPQDTGVARRGVFPLGPTTITHRGVGGKNGQKR